MVFQQVLLEETPPAFTISFVLFFFLFFFAEGRGLKAAGGWKRKKKWSHKMISSSSFYLFTVFHSFLNPNHFS